MADLKAAFNNLYDVKSVAHDLGIGRIDDQANIERLIAATVSLLDENGSEKPGAGMLNVDLGPSYQVAKDHENQWRSSVTSEKPHVADFIASYMRLVPFLNKDMTIKGGGIALKAVGKVGNKLSNISADLMHARTSEPHFVTERYLYLPRKSTDKEVFYKTGQILDCFSLNIHKIREFDAIAPTYRNVDRVAELFAKTGLAEFGEARRRIITAFPNSGGYGRMTHKYMGAKGLGLRFHFGTEEEMVLSMLAIAACGAFHGRLASRAWERILLEGAWPSLRGYRKAYSRVVFTVTASLFAALELDYVNANVTTLMSRLIKTVVGGGEAGARWKVRKAHALTIEKIRVAAVEGVDPKKPAETANANAANANEPAPEPARKWEPNTRAIVAQDPARPLTHCILDGCECDHGEELAFNSRVLPAYSLEEVATQILNGKQLDITVAMTGSDEEARKEVEGFALQETIVTVRRAQGQCFYCIWRLAWGTSALLIII